MKLERFRRWLRWWLFRDSIEAVDMELEALKASLERARVLKFMRVVPYYRGMKIVGDDRPASISLVELGGRLAKLEQARGSVV